MKSSFQLKFIQIKEIEVKMNLLLSVPDLSCHYVSSATIGLGFHYVHLTNNMSFLPAGVKLIERNRCFVPEIRKINGFH